MLSRRQLMNLLTFAVIACVSLPALIFVGRLLVAFRAATGQ